MFKPTPEELELLADILTFAGSEESRILPTEKAIDIFERSNLHRNELKEIWRHADKDRNGMLTSMELAVALRLIGWVQAGEELGGHLIDLPGPLPTLQGISDVKRRQGPPVIPAELSPRRPSAHSRSPSLPFFGHQGHTLSYSSESLPASSTPFTPPPPPSGKSESALPLSPLDDDDLANPIINLPPNSLQTIKSLSCPPGRGKRRVRTIDESHSGSVAPVQPPLVSFPVPPPPPPPPPPLPSNLSPLQFQGSTSNTSFLPTPPPTGVTSPDGSVSESPAQPDKNEGNAAMAITPVKTLSPKLSHVEVSVQVEVEQVPLDELLEEAFQPTLLEVVVDEVPQHLPEVESAVDPTPVQSDDPVHLEADTQEIKRLTELLEASNLRALFLESKLVENEVAVSKLANATDLELKQLRAQCEEATARVAELESFEKEYRDTAALVETVTRDLHELATEKDALQKDMQVKLDAKDKEIMDLEKRVSEAAEESQKLVKQNAVTAQSLTAENIRLTRRLEDREQVFANEKAELLKRLQEMEAIAAELEWAGGGPDPDLQQALESATRENVALKRQMQELQTKMMLQQQDRGQHEVEMSRVQRRPRVTEIRSDPPPPAYDDAVFV